MCLKAPPLPQPQTSIFIILCRKLVRLFSPSKKTGESFFPLEFNLVFRLLGKKRSAGKRKGGRNQVFPDLNRNVWIAFFPWPTYCAFPNEEKKSPFPFWRGEREKNSLRAPLGVDFQGMEREILSPLSTIYSLSKKSMTRAKKYFKWKHILSPHANWLKSRNADLALERQEEGGHPITIWVTTQEIKTSPTHGAKKCRDRRKEMVYKQTRFVRKRKPHFQFTNYKQGRVFPHKKLRDEKKKDGLDSFPASSLSSFSSQLLSASAQVSDSPPPPHVERGRRKREIRLD